VKANTTQKAYPMKKGLSLDRWGLIDGMEQGGAESGAKLCNHRLSFKLVAEYALAAY